MIPHTYNWFAIRVRTNYEWVASTGLLERRFDVLLPTYRDSRKWSDREKRVEVPLFPGYLFCCFDLAERLRVLSTPGVMYIVGTSNVIPEAIPEWEIASLRSLVTSGLQAEPVPYLEVGKLIRIERGPLAGVEGVLAEFKNRGRIIVSITLLQRSVAAEVNLDWVNRVA